MRESLYRIVSHIVPTGTLCDAFGGVGSIGSFFKSKGYAVWSGDVLRFAYYFQLARIERNTMPSFARVRKRHGLRSTTEVVNFLNKLRPKYSWIVSEYARERRFFTVENAARIDACRMQIREWSEANLLSNSERAVLLASLINSMDRVANTAGTYYAFLKRWDRHALRPFQFGLIPCTPGPPSRSFRAEAKDLVAMRAFDILYLDPPHNRRSYSRYYHLPESIALQQTPKTCGKSGMAIRENPCSDFGNPRRVGKALEELLSRASFRIALFHYSEDGLMSSDEVRGILAANGNVEEHKLKSFGYTTRQAARTAEHHLYVVRNATRSARLGK